jgi:hypothetical protein
MWQPVKQIRRIVNQKNCVDQSVDIVKSKFVILIIVVGLRNVVGH